MPPAPLRPRPPIRLGRGCRAGERRYAMREGHAGSSRACVTRGGPDRPASVTLIPIIDNGGQCCARSAPGPTYGHPSQPDAMPSAQKKEGRSCDRPRLQGNDLREPGENPVLRLTPDRIVVMTARHRIRSNRSRIGLVDPTRTRVALLLPGSQALSTAKSCLPNLPRCGQWTPCSARLRQVRIA